jgi:16S rRNA C967 or C1407 C5-methylase (RsmB/RsmF family)
MVRVGGVVIYITCTLAKEENEGVAGRFEENFCRVDGGSNTTTSASTSSSDESSDGSGSISSSSDADSTSMVFERAPLVEAWGTEIARRVLLVPGAGCAGGDGGGGSGSCNSAATDTGTSDEDLRMRTDDDAMQSNAVTLLPHVHGTDGFFVARWRRVA